MRDEGDENGAWRERKKEADYCTTFSWPLYGLLTIALGLSKAKTPINDLLNITSLGTYYGI